MNRVEAVEARERIEEDLERDGYGPASIGDKHLRICLEALDLFLSPQPVLVTDERLDAARAAYEAFTAPADMPLLVEEREAMRAALEAAGSSVPTPVLIPDELRDAAEMLVGFWNGPHDGRTERDEAVEPWIHALESALSSSREPSKHDRRHEIYPFRRVSGRGE